MCVCACMLQANKQSVSSVWSWMWFISTFTQHRRTNNEANILLFSKFMWNKLSSYKPLKVRIGAHIKGIRDIGIKSIRKSHEVRQKSAKIVQKEEKNKTKSCKTNENAEPFYSSIVSQCVCMCFGVRFLVRQKHNRFYWRWKPIKGILSVLIWYNGLCSSILIAIMFYSRIKIHANEEKEFFFIIFN